MLSGPEMAPSRELSPTMKAIRDVSMTYFDCDSWSSTGGDKRNDIEAVVEKYLTGEISYDIAQQHIIFLIGVSHPLERVRDIVEMSPEPIPDPYASFQRKNTHQRKKTRPWTSYEDQRLLSGIYRNGIENWTAISKFVGNGRNRSQCSQRWYRGLDPTISKDKWSTEEEEKLTFLISRFGDKSWTQIATMMGNRTDVQCRYKYKQILKEQLPESSHKRRQKKKPIPWAPPHHPPLPPIDALIAQTSSCPLHTPSRIVTHQTLALPKHNCIY